MQNKKFVNSELLQTLRPITYPKFTQFGAYLFFVRKGLSLPARVWAWFCRVLQLPILNDFSRNRWAAGRRAGRIYPPLMGIVYRHSQSTPPYPSPVQHSTYLSQSTPPYPSPVQHITYLSQSSPPYPSPVQHSTYLSQSTPPYPSPVQYSTYLSQSTPPYPSPVQYSTYLSQSTPPYPSPVQYSTYFSHSLVEKGCLKWTTSFSNSDFFLHRMTPPG
jgi:hypothetical protein